MDTPTVYIPMDWRQAMARGETLPERVQGAALFADISGFTPLTEALAKELGPQRGAEELAKHLNRVYNALIAELHRFGGSVIGFSGDAITCWLDRDGGSRAVACALAMQAAMQQFAEVQTAAGTTVALAMKAAVAVGPARRFVVGDPQIQLIDVLAGTTLDHLAAAEHQAEKGEIVLDPAAINSLSDRVEVVTWRMDEQTGQRFAVVDKLLVEVEEHPWQPLDDDALSEEQVRAWLLPPVYERLRTGGGEFLAELRPAVTLFARFSGIDYDRDETAGLKLDTFIRAVQGILQRYEGTLIQLTVGDKGSYLYAAFGAPIAHEDDVVRASSAALELRALVEASEDIEEVQIGITRGRMRTGAYGSTTRRTYGVLGDAVNLSARLMVAAKAGQILVSDEAKKSTADTFIWEQLPNIRVKGKSNLVTIASLIGKKERPSLHLQEPRYTLPMVGRREELARVAEQIAQVMAGKGQIIGITAEAGMGKSRLAAEVIRLASEAGLLAYGGECQSYGATTSYLVWQNVWRGFFDLDPIATVEEQVAALREQLLQINPALVQRLPLLGAVLNLPIPDNELTRSMDAKLRKSSLEALLVDCLRARATQSPLLIVLEDCHWIDPLSQDLIEVIGRAIAKLPVLLLLVYRPPEPNEIQALLVSQLPHFAEIALEQFTAEEAEQLIGLKLARLLGAETTVPPQLVERVVEHAEGNPFYIDEFLNYLHDKGVDPHDLAAVASLDLPASLHSLVLSRIDQLSEDHKITLKIASVIGRLFRVGMLWGVHPQADAFERVRRDLDVLSELEFTPLDMPEPEATYLFKHIVTQEVAYESLPFATRAMLHEQIGGYIEQAYTDTLDQYVDLLAHHYWHSENDDKKREYLLRAGETSQMEYANKAAVSYFERLIPLLPDVEQGSVILKLGKVHELVGSWDDAGRQYEVALKLAEQLDDRPTLAWCQIAIAELFRKRGQYREAREWLDLSRTGFDGLSDQEGIAQTLHYAGTLADQQGDHKMARTLYEKSLGVRQQLGDKPGTARLLSNLGIVARREGDHATARSLYEASLALRREIGDKWAIAASLNNLGNLALDEGNHVEAYDRLNEAATLQQEVGDRWGTANSLHNLANVARTEGDYQAARKLYAESVAIWQELDEKWALAYWFEDVGSLSALRGDPDRALHLCAVASVLREEIGSPLSPTEQNKLEQVLQRSRKALSEEEQTAAWDAGQAMSLEEAIEHAMQDGSP